MALRRKKKQETGSPADAPPAAATDASPPEQTQSQAAQPEPAPPGPPPPAPPAPRAKARKQPRPERRPAAVGAATGVPSSLLDLSDRLPSREEMEREAAAELEAAIAPSWSRLMAEVPDAGSPVEAVQKIESRLGPLKPDQDPDLPRHPIYQGDTLVYYQLRRHYGSPNPGGSFWRSWFPQR